MKKILITLLAVMFVGPVAAEEIKIGVLDLGKVIAKSPQREATAEKINKQFAGKLEELKALAEKQQKLTETIKRDALTMTEDQKIKAEREWKELDADIKLKNAALKEDSQRAQKVEMDKIIVRIQSAIDKVAKDEGFDLIIRTDSILFADKKIDISDKVLTIISNPAG